MKLFTVAIDRRPVVVISAIGDDVQEILDALENTLGEDLRSLGLWDGRLGRLQIRPARPHEARRWHGSRRRAIEQGKHDAADMRWLLFLVPMPLRRATP